MARRRSKHLANVFDEGELDQDAVGAVLAHTAAADKTYLVQHYALDAHRCRQDRAFEREVQRIERPES